MMILCPRRLAAILGLLLACAAGRAFGDGLVPLAGHRTSAAAAASVTGPVAPTEPIPLTLALAPRDPRGLDRLLRRLYDPADPLYGRFLTPAQFADRFSPTPAQYAAVAAFARARGLAVTGTTANRLLLHVEAPSAAVEAAFGVHLRRMVDARGRHFHAPDREPQVPAAVAPLLVGVVGLDDSAVWQPHLVPRAAAPDVTALADPLQIGTGPGGGLSPADIRAAYQLSGLPASVNGAGQTLAVFELDGYKPADITAYENQFQSQLGVTQFPAVTAIPVDGGPGALGAGQAEVTLDIELQMALAPGVGSILVYEGPNSGQGLLDTYSRIALDDQAKQVSTSWGLAEDEGGSSFIAAEAPIFAQMAAQGQTLYAAAGDSGAYDDGRTLSVDDPASQPYVTGTGGTTLTLGAGGVRASESAWGSGGGGASAVWPIPFWQLPLIGPASNASTAMRNVPDVALDSNPYTGYAISLNGGWALYGGTSCAAPLWAAFTALVNQERAATGKQPLGFANPLLYAIGQGLYGSYINDFYDVTTGSNGSNGYFSAVPGYDDTTGLGTFNGASLLADLVAGPSAGPTLTAAAGASGSGVVLTWTPVPGATGYSVYRAVTSGAEGATPLQAGLAATTQTYTDLGVTGGTAYYYVVTALSASGVAVPSNEVSVTPPVAVAVTSSGANPATVVGTTTTLYAQATVPQGQTLAFTWSATGPAPVTYSLNGTASAGSTTATFTKAGNYSFTVTAGDTAGQSATATVAVTVNQTPSQVTVTPASVTLSTGQTQQFAAAGTDQFGAAMPVTPTWSVPSAAGSVSAGGLFTAAAPGGPYTVTATQGAATGTAQATVTAPAAPAAVALNAGGGAAGAFAADTDYSGGTAAHTTAGVSTAGVTDPAPQAVYQTERYGNFAYTLPGLTPGAAYTLRLHFTEIYWTSAGRRLFNVSVNGLQVLTNFDVFAAAGGKDRAIVESLPVTADGNGRVVIQFTTLRDNAKVSGIEIVPSTAPTSTPPAGPTITAAATATPNPVSGTTAGLSVSATDPGGAGSLVYTWSGPAGVSFSPNGTTSSAGTTATFTGAGSYPVQVTVRDSSGLTASSNVTVVVTQTPTALTVSPATATVTTGQTQQFAAAVSDQFGSPIAGAPVTWSVPSAAGTISAGGLFAAGVTAGTYTVTATSGTATGSAAVTVAAPAPTGIALNAGGGAAGAFAADTDYSGGTAAHTTAGVSTAGVTDPAPQAVYQTERYGNFAYTLPGLTPGAAYTLRLHFTEIYWTSAGRRLFNVSVNGLQVLTNFDVFAAAGGKDRAVVESLPVTADGNGRVVIQFTTLRDNAKVSGIELTQ